MANPTSNFGWQMPTSTDLVTDLPADFETFGQAVDTSLADLKGGTSGQVLKKNSNTDMDFVWSSDATGMTNPMTTTGDTIYSSSGSTPARLGIGSTGQVLTVSGGVPVWASPAGGGKVAQVVALTGTNTVALTTTDQTIESLSITPTSSTSKIYISSTIRLKTNYASGSIDGSAQARIYRNSTQVGNPCYEEGYGLQANVNDSNLLLTLPLIYLDSPATTSAVTYNIKAKEIYSTRTSYASQCVITLWEITA
jgi:hypothetical protein